VHALTRPPMHTTSPNSKEKTEDNLSNVTYYLSARNKRKCHCRKERGNLTIAHFCSIDCFINGISVQKQLKGKNVHEFQSLNKREIRIRRGLYHVVI
jgi:hypothetical protein